MGQAIIQSCVMSLATQSPYLMHAVLGVAAAHMSYLLPPEVNAIRHRRSRLTDAWHWSQALALFRKELSGERSSAGVNRDSMDALLSTIMLVAIHQFMLRGEDDQLMSHTEDLNDWRNSFVFIENDEKREEAMKWLTIQSGFKLLLRQLDQYLRESVWLPVFLDAEIENQFDLLHLASTGPFQEKFDEIESLLCEICGISDSSNKENNQYYDTLEIVLFVRRLRPMRAEVFNKLITVMGRISPEMQRLIWMRNGPALLILCHWLALMAALKQWWIGARAERECRAIVMYLLAQDLGETEAIRMRKVLVEPAAAVGIVL